VNGTALRAEPAYLSSIADLGWELVCVAKKKKRSNPRRRRLAQTEVAGERLQLTGWD
jgi:hypothetical protein